MRDGIYKGKDMIQRFIGYLKQESGATSVEYGLIAAGIALTIVAIVFLLGDEVLAMFNDVAAIFVW